MGLYARSADSFVRAYLAYVLEVRTKRRTFLAGWRPGQPVKQSDHRRNRRREEADVADAWLPHSVSLHRRLLFNGLLANDPCLAALVCRFEGSSHGKREHDH